MTGEIEFRRHIVKAIIELAQNDNWMLSQVRESDATTLVVFVLREPYQWIKERNRSQSIGTVHVTITAESKDGPRYDT